MTLPAGRWQGIWFPRVDGREPFMQLMVDSLEPILRRHTAYPTNDYDNIDASLLPLLAWQLDAYGYDPTGGETQGRRALAESRRLHTVTGAPGAFDLLMLLNGTSGTLRLVGDYDSAGQPVARIENRMQGTHSRHTASPTVEDTLRGTDGLPSATPNPAFSWDNLVYHKYAAIDVVQPPGRPNREQFIDYLLRAAQRTLPFTLEVVEVNLLRSQTAPVSVTPQATAMHAYYVGGS